MAFGKPSTGIAIKLGIGGRPKPAGGPPPFGGGKAAPTTPDIPDQAEEQKENVTADMLEYHPSQPCGECSHFTAPTTCDRFPEPVEENGHCNGWETAGRTDLMPEDSAMPREAMA